MKAPVPHNCMKHNSYHQNQLKFFADAAQHLPYGNTLTCTEHSDSVLTRQHMSDFYPFVWLQDELGPPALAFVRTVCAVLALDSALEQEVAVLRRNLLKLVHVREFSSAAEFQVSTTTGQRSPNVQVAELQSEKQYV